jgi:hypothetical protein
MDLAAPDRQLLAIGPEASAILWPAHASGTRDSAPTITLENGSTVVAESVHRWSGNLRTIVRLPGEFWQWWAEQEGADALLLSCIDGEASRFSARGVNAGSLDPEEVAARNAAILQVTADIMRRSRSMLVGDMARRLLARGIFGDELQHDVELAGTFTPDESLTYPRVVEIHGDAPPQYPNLEAWDEEIEGDEEDDEEEEDRR